MHAAPHYEPSATPISAPHSDEAATGVSEKWRLWAEGGGAAGEEQHLEISLLRLLQEGFL